MKEKNQLGNGEKPMGIMKALSEILENVVA